ncbi:hypothetical protein SAMN04489806_3019 [Paramicrobacterium humi]|uniref:Glyoxalase-like domain-containing protein n=1 Tax=Paramicrobacterium humi TaxID=640635 RepID=A0A1H4R701_9MICO|nr:glyoxalase [Microbacterium humi]SEC27598.1 hypothetical protein SAMN04489806_3019 [Microbacterium humi]
MSSISSVILGTPDPEAAERFYANAFDLGDRVGVRASDEATSGFRGFTLSLIAAQPSNVDALVDAALAAGGTTLKPVAKSLWGYGGLISAPDGAIWNIATSAKKNAEPASRSIEHVVLLLGATDVKASKEFYVDRGFTVVKGFGNGYVEFAPSGRINLGLYRRRSLAKSAGVPDDGTGSHRLTIVGDAAAAADPDGFQWESAAATA